MNCEHPIRIRNQYTGKYMYVPCRHCDACRINIANKKAVELEKCLTNYKTLVFVTLTYANDYVPYVVPGFSYIFRGMSNAMEIIDDLDEPIPEDFASPALQGHDVPNAIGVLYYRDVQLFLKRFRKFINTGYGKRTIKYFAIGEYGSRFGRNHYHLVLMSNDATFAEMQCAAFACWTYHDWSKFANDGINKAFKVCDQSTAYYVASYVNSGADSVPISLVDRFQQRTFRSKNMDFGCCQSELEIFRDSVRRIYYGHDYEMHDGIVRPFVFIDRTRKDNVSERVVSQRYLHAAFSAPKGCNEMDFGTFYARACNLVDTFSRAEEQGISKSVAHSPWMIHNKSADMAFYRAYKRHSQVLGFALQLPDYLDLMWRVLAYYHSQVLRQQMESYETCNNKDEYFLELINTHVEKLKRKELCLKLKMKTDQYRGRNFAKINLECPPLSTRIIAERRKKYRKRLLKKHLNDVYHII